MRSSIILSLAATSASAWQHATGMSARNYETNPWSPPGPSDSRSPCPGLNTLANHGFLPHDGRNISVEDIAVAINAAFNWDPALGTVPGAGAFKLIGLDPKTARIDLEDLNAPNATEHRASLTRDDAEAGDPLVLNPERLQALLDDGSDDEALSVASLARSRLRVQAESGPPFLTETQGQTASQEASILLLLMNVIAVPPAAGEGEDAADYSVLRAPNELVDAWLRDEKLPIEHGWAPPERTVQLADALGVGAAILAEMEAQAGEGKPWRAL